LAWGGSGHTAWRGEKPLWLEKKKDNPDKRKGKARSPQKPSMKFYPVGQKKTASPSACDRGVRTPKHPKVTLVPGKTTTVRKKTNGTTKTPMHQPDTDSKHLKTVHTGVLSGATTVKEKNQVPEISKKVGISPSDSE